MINHCIIQCIRYCRKLPTLVNVICFLLVYWWEQGVPFIEYVWESATGNFIWIFKRSPIGSWCFLWISGELSGFQATGNWEFYPDFNAISSREFRLDFEQSVVGEFYPKMYQKRISKRASKNRCFPLKTVLGLQNPLRTRSLTPLKIDHKSSLILEGRKLKNKQTLHTFPHFLNFKAIKNHPNTFPKAVLNCLSAVDNRISYLDTGAAIENPFWISGQAGWEFHLDFQQSAFGNSSWNSSWISGQSAVETSFGFRPIGI